METLDQERLIKCQQKYETIQEPNLSLLSKTGFKWIELLESEFDKRFLELNLFLNRLLDAGCPPNESEKDERVSNAKSTLNELSSIFAQLAHKCLVAFDHSTKLERDLESCRKELKFARSGAKVLENKLKDNQVKQSELINFNHYNSLNRQTVNSTRLSYPNRVMSLSNVSRSSSLFNVTPFNIKCNGPQSNECNFSEIYAEEEIRNLRDDNQSLRKLNISLKSELFGNRLAIKYLQKELTGRIQQIQILSKSDLTKLDQSRLWNQIETEIHLSRSKTVIKACRDRGQIVLGQQPNSPEICDYHSAKKNHGICEIRRVSIEKTKSEGLGISITGGKEYGIPIIISEIHRNTPAARSGRLYIGDSILSVNQIDLSDVMHTEAAQILLSQSGDVVELECVFVLSDFDESDTSSEHDGCASRYCYFDSRIMHNSEPEHQPTRLTERKDDDLIEFKKSFDGDLEDDDNISSITAFSSPTKLYPGCARSLASLFAPHANNRIKEKAEVLEIARDETGYDQIKLQTLDGCQVFYKNKSTIIN